MIDLHNDVNKDTKKPIMSYEDIYKLYGYNYKIFSYPVNKNPIKLELVKKEPVKLEVVKKEPVKLEIIEKNPIKLELVKKEPLKLELIKKEPVKLQPVTSVKQNYQNYLLELNKKLRSNSVSVSNIPNTRNNIIKQGMMRAINRGRKYNK